MLSDAGHAQPADPGKDELFVMMRAALCGLWPSPPTKQLPELKVFETFLGRWIPFVPAALGLDVSRLVVLCGTCMAWHDIRTIGAGGANYHRKPWRLMNTYCIHCNLTEDKCPATT